MEIHIFKFIQQVETQLLVNMKDVVVLIPAYNPTDNLYKLVLELINLKFQKIIIKRIILDKQI